MNTYKIVLVKDDFIKYINNYQSILRKLLIEEKSMFDTKQLQLTFKSSADIKEYFQLELFSREDYSYFHGVHKLYNEITGEIITFIINQYDIEVSEKDGSYVIFDYLKQFSSNFFMFDI